MTDSYTHMSQQFDCLTKNFSEKTIPLKVPKKQSTTKLEKKQESQNENQTKSQSKQPSQKTQNENVNVSNKPPSGSQKSKQSQNQQTASKASTPYVSSKLTESQKKTVSQSQQQQSAQGESQRNNSDNMKSVMTMSDDQKSQASKANSFQRPKSQSRLWSEHTIRTESQRAKKVEEKKLKDEDKIKWHYQGEQKDKKSFDYFKTTRVSTCSYIQKVGDVLLALPFYKAPQREKEMKLQKESLKANDFKVRPQTCTSSTKKPLEPYNPNAARNILKQADVKMPHRNTTTFELSDGSDVRNMYKSNNKNIYGNFPQQYHSNNPAIASDLVKRIHKQNDK